MVDLINIRTTIMVSKGIKIIIRTEIITNLKNKKYCQKEMPKILITEFSNLIKIKVLL